VDLSKNAYVTGQTSSTKFPIVNATQTTIGGGNDAFVSEINVAGSLIFSTYLGGSLNENTNASGGQLAALGSIAVDGPGANVYVTGNTLSTDFPRTAPEQKTEAGGIDAFVVKYAFPTAPDFSISATTPTTVAPGTSGTSTVTLTAINAYASSVNLTCAVTGTGSPLPACQRHKLRYQSGNADCGWRQVNSYHHHHGRQCGNGSSLEALLRDVAADWQAWRSSGWASAPLAPGGRNCWAS